MKETDSSSPRACGDPFEGFDGGGDAAGFQARDGWLGAADPGELGLGGNDERSAWVSCARMAILKAMGFSRSSRGSKAMDTEASAGAAGAPEGALHRSSQCEGGLRRDEEAAALQREASRRLSLEERFRQNDSMSRFRAEALQSRDRYP